MASPDTNTVPAAPPPPGQQPNFANPPTDNAPFIAFYTIFIVTSTPFVALRIYTRQVITRKLWWDDWTCLVGWLFMIGFIGIELYMLNLGGTAEMWDVSKATHKQFQKYFKDVEIVARVGIFFTKASIVLLFLRLFCPHGARKRATWWGIWFVFWWNLLYAVALVLVVLLQCVGKEELEAAGKQCVDEYAVLICASVINVVTDLMIMVIPIGAIRGLQMSSNRKLKWTAAFAVGILGVLASVARLVYQIIYATNQTQIVTSVLILLATAEQYIGVLLPCLAAIPAFYRHIRKQEPETPPLTNYSNGKHSAPRVLGSGTKASAGTRGKVPDPYPVYSNAGHEESGELRSQSSRDGDDIMLVPTTAQGHTIGVAE